MGVTVDELRPPLVLELSGVGRVVLQSFSLADLDRIAEDRKRPDFDPLSILEGQVRPGEVALPEIGSWSLEAKLEVLNQFSTYEFNVPVDASDEEASIHSFLVNFDKWRTDQMESIKQAIGSIRSQFSVPPFVTAAESVLQAAKVWSPTLEKFHSMQSGMEAAMRVASMASGMTDAMERVRKLTSGFDTIHKLATFGNPALSAAHTLQKAFEPIRALQAIQDQFRVKSNIFTFPQPGSLFKAFAQLPDFSALQKNLEEARKALNEGKDTLDEAGFGFAFTLFNLRTIRIVSVPKARRRPATTTNQFLSLTRGSEFAEALEKELGKSAAGKRRIKAVREGLHAHNQRHYFASIPVLTAQVEGLISDLLVIAKAYRRRKGAWIVVATGDKPKGLHQKINEQAFQDMEGLDYLREAIIQSVFDSGLGTKKTLTATRNDVLHGQSHTYGKPKLSVQLVIAIFVLAREVAEAEKEARKPKRAKAAKV